MFAPPHPRYSAPPASGNRPNPPQARAIFTVFSYSLSLDHNPLSLLPIIPLSQESGTIAPVRSTPPCSHRHFPRPYSLPFAQARFLRARPLLCRW